MRLFTLAACFITAAVPALAEPVTIETARGPVSIEAAPKTLAVYDLGALDTLTALGVPVAGVPDRILLPYLSDAAKDAKPVGTFFEPDMEKLATLAPDAIVLGGRSAPKFDQVSALAPTLDMTVSPDLLASLNTYLTSYGQLFDKEDKAKELAAALEAKVAEVRSVSTEQGDALVILTNGTKMAAYGNGSRFGWLYDVTGLPEAHEGLKTDSHGNAISYEFIAETDPDWIFVVDRSAAVGQEGTSAAETLNNPLVASTKAAKNDHIIYLNAGNMYLSSGGYSGTMEILGELHDALTKK